MDKIRNGIRVINCDTRSSTARSVELWPDITRACLLGGSGCGKTNAMITILLHRKPLRSVYLCSRTADQEKYLLLKELVEKHNEKHRSNEKKIKLVEVSLEKLPVPEQIDRDSVVIFDDLLVEKAQDKIAAFFMRGRHRGISCFYLSQSYTKIPKKTGIRENFNYLILFKQDLINLRQIYAEHISDISFEKFRDLCRKCWAEKYSFLVVDLESERSRFKKKFEYEFRL